MIPINVGRTITQINMGNSALTLFLVLFSSISLSISDHSISDNFLGCVSSQSFNAPTPITSVLFSPSNSSYSSILNFSIQNLRFMSTTTLKPLFIIRPKHATHIQAMVICSKKHGLQTRVRSGGHDYEGLSYTASKPFIIIDLMNYRKVSVNVKDMSAWVQAGATLGEVYYHIAEASSTHGFPAGVCPTVGVGGHISGGGLGTLMRKHGLAADNILDAYVIDVYGRLLNRKSMGEDLFWAIRGGGGASFAVIVSWKIKLVPVPSTVTVFRVFKTLEEGATSVVSKWQHIAHKIHENLFVRLIIHSIAPVNGSETTIQFIFQSLFLGNIDQLLPLMEKNFPQLGLKAKDCTEMSWINSILFFNWFPDGESTNVLLNRTQSSKSYFMAKSDFVNEPISKSDLKGIWKLLLREDSPNLNMIWEPLGGRMGEISESASPFPHRAGNLFNIQYFLQWQEGGFNASETYKQSLRRLHNYMTPYVSKSPRAAYMNYRDLDLGENEDARTNYSKASSWGIKYFKGNFQRLALVKNKVDPENLFWNQQSIPALSL